MFNLTRAEIVKSKDGKVGNATDSGPLKAKIK